MQDNDSQAPPDGPESDERPNPWWDLLGIGEEQVTRGSCRLRLHPSDAARRWPSGPIRAGVLASLMEAAVCTAVGSLDIPGMHDWVIVDLSMSLLTPVSEDVVANAHVIQAGAGAAKGEADLIDASGNLVARGTVCVASSQD